MEDLVAHAADATYEVAVHDDKKPTEPWPKPDSEELANFKKNKAKQEPTWLEIKTVQKNELGKYLYQRHRSSSIQNSRSGFSGRSRSISVSRRSISARSIGRSRRVSARKLDEQTLWELSEECAEYCHMMWVRDRPVVLKDFAQFRVLGKGAFGLVEGVRRCSSGHMYANKIQNKKRMKDKGRGIMELAMAEKQALALMASPFVIGLHYAFQDKDNVYLVLELLSGGDLQYHLNQRKRFGMAEATYYLACTLQGIGCIHDQGWCYRDLKPENILLSANGICKISDLGLATIVGKGVRHPAGTQGYWAPEMIKDEDGKIKPYDERCDFWSLGVVAYAFFFGMCPFWQVSDKKDINKATLTMELEYDKDIFTKKATEFCIALLQRNPESRLGTDEGWRDIEEHEFFEGFDFDSLREGSMEPPFKPKDTLNAKAADEIGAHKEAKATWTDKDEKIFHDWDFISHDRFYEEAVVSLKWAEENGKPEPKKSSACTIL